MPAARPNDASSVTLVLGGVRSGKSALAERLARAADRPALYVATARATDDEMTERIARHRASRPTHWRTVEAPLDLVVAVKHHAARGDVVVVDCLTVWLGNRFVEGIGLEADPELIDEQRWAALESGAVEHAVALCDVARQRGLRLVLVSNEVGMGVVPATSLGRRYRDALGRVNQAVAATADSVLLTVAGLGVDLKALERATLAGFAS